MVLSFGVWLIVLGILGAANLIIAKMPAARDMIAKMAPYQGWFGAVSVFYGIWEIISAVLGMGLMAQHPPFGLIFWLLYLASGLLQVGLGILFGIGVIKTFVKQPQAVAKMDQMVLKLTPFQGILGIIAIGVGVAFLVVDLVLL